MNRRVRAEIVASIMLAALALAMVLMVAIYPKVLSFYGWVFGTVGAFRVCMVAWKFVCDIAKPSKVRPSKNK